MDDILEIAGVTLTSRLILGTGGASSMAALEEAIRASGTELVTVALRRVTPGVAGSVLDVCDRTGVRVLPNTAGCFTATEAVRTARAARDAFETDWVKLEVIADERTLLPDPVELLTAAETLVAEGFVVFPYASDDPIVAARLVQVGCPVVMPLGAPIGSGMAIRRPRRRDRHGLRRRPGHGVGLRRVSRRTESTKSPTSSPRAKHHYRRRTTNKRHDKTVRTMSPTFSPNSRWPTGPNGRSGPSSWIRRTSPLRLGMRRRARGLG